MRWNLSRIYGKGRTDKTQSNFRITNAPSNMKNDSTKHKTNDSNNKSCTQKAKRKAAGDGDSCEGIVKKWRENERDAIQVQTLC